MQSLTRILAFLICIILAYTSSWAQTVPETVDSPNADRPTATIEPNTDTDAPNNVVNDTGLETPKKSQTSPRSKRDHDRRFPAALGAIGIDRTLSAHVGVVDTVRLRAALGGFSTTDFPLSGADNDFIETGLSIGYTPSDFAEIYVLVGGTSNTNSLGRPALIQTQGDMSLGAKFVGAISPMVSAGGALNIHLLSDVGSGGFAWGATSTELRGLLTVDMKAADNEPLRMNFNLGYLIEKGAELSHGIEGEPSLVQEFGLQTARYDRVTLGMGLEVPLEEPIVPFAEYEVALPILVELGRRSEDSNDYSFFSIPHSIAVGLRGFVSENFVIESSVRFGLSDQFYTGVPATPPWLANFAIAYHLDPVPVVVEKTVAPAAPIVPPAPKLNTAKAQVVSEAGDKPLAGATIRYVDRMDLTPQVTGPSGEFTSYALEDGIVRLRISAEGFVDSEVELAIGADAIETATYKLKTDPNDKRGKVVIITVNESGRTIPATLQFGGSARDITGRTNPRGRYERSLGSGRYPVTVNARGYAEVNRNFVVKSAETTEVKITLAPIKRPQAAPVAVAPSGGGGGSLATVTTKGIKLKRKIMFTKGSSALTSASKRVLRSVAAGLKRVSQITKVRIEVHTSGRGEPTEQVKLSRERAKKIKSYLVSNGVDRKRLRVRGFGGKKPLAPPITKRGRLKNERVDFKVLKVK